DDAVQCEQVELQIATVVVHLVGKGQRDIKVRKARQMEPGLFVAGIELVEQAVETNQTLVGILRGKVHAVVVIPQSAQRFIDVAVRRIGRTKARQDVGVV